MMEILDGCMTTLNSVEAVTLKSGGVWAAAMANSVSVIVSRIWYMVSNGILGAIEYVARSRASSRSITRAKQYCVSTKSGQENKALTL